MDAVNVAIVVGALVIGVVSLVWFAVAKNHPEDGCSHYGPHPPTPSDELYTGVDRPAGPDAEPTDPDALGGDQGRPPPAGAGS